MTIKEIHAKAGFAPGYIWYIFLVSGWYFLENSYAALAPGLPENSNLPLLVWGLRSLIVPFLLAGVIGGIHEQQQDQEVSSIAAFLKHARSHYWRILVANLVATVFYFLLSLLIGMVGFFSAGGQEPPNSFFTTILTITDFPYSAITLFWFSAIVIERSLFGSLFRSIKTLFTNPYALIVGIAWGAMRLADNSVVDLLGNQNSLLTDGLRAGVLALARVAITAYALSIYKKARGFVQEEAAPGNVLEAAPITTAGDGLVKASFGFAFFSFIPLLHLVALALGALALRKKKRFMVRPAIAVWMGGFFTIYYLLLILAWVSSAAAPRQARSYRFLAEANADLEPYVGLLEQGLYADVLQFEQQTGSSTDHHWAYDAALALAKYDSDGSEAALNDFKTAAAKKPERSEFYYYYGIALLENGLPDQAAEQFTAALSMDPQLKGAERYLELINNAYSPSQVISAVLFMIILLIMFTVHEYGHAFAAWKLGDDTAKSLGRLTLNPIAHLDLIGSILLPAILLMRQSEFMFGWAKPVPVNPQNFKNPRKDQMVVSFAGPAVNLFVSMVCFILLGGILVFIRLVWPETLTLNYAVPFSAVSIVGPPFAKWLTIVVVDIKQLFYTSLVLGIFNLIPIPPLDGSWILSGLLPQKMHLFFEGIRKFSFVIFLLLVVTPVLDYILVVPLGLVYTAFEILVTVAGLG